MEFRAFGRTGLRVSVLGMGLSRVGAMLAASGTAAAERAIATALDHGINFFDTANIYGQGDSERILGRMLKGRRDGIVIETKAGFVLPAPGILARVVKPVLAGASRRVPALRELLRRRRATGYAQDFTPQRIIAEIEASLCRLGVETIDSFMLHNPPVDLVTAPELIAALTRLKQAGHVRAIGIACAGAAEAAWWLGYPGIEAIQVTVNPLLDPALKPILQRAQDQGCAVVGREPFGGGAWFTHIAASSDLAAALARLGVTPVAAALRFTLAQPGVATVLPGMSSAHHVESALAGLAPLPADLDAALASVLASVPPFPRSHL